MKIILLFDMKKVVLKNVRKKEKINALPREETNFSIFYWNA